MIPTARMSTEGCFERIAVFQVARMATEDFVGSVIVFQVQGWILKTLLKVL